MAKDINHNRPGHMLWWMIHCPCLDLRWFSCRICVCELGNSGSRMTFRLCHLNYGGVDHYQSWVFNLCNLLNWDMWVGHLLPMEQWIILNLFVLIFCTNNKYLWEELIHMHSKICWDLFLLHTMIFFLNQYLRIKMSIVLGPDFSFFF